MHAKYGRNYVCRPSLFVGRTVQATCTCTVPTFRVFVRHLQRPTFPAVPASVSFSVLVVPAFICTRNCDASPRHRTQQKWFLCRLRRKKRINHRWAKPTSKASTLRTHITHHASLCARDNTYIPYRPIPIYLLASRVPPAQDSISRLVPHPMNFSDDGQQAADGRNPNSSHLDSPTPCGDSALTQQGLQTLFAAFGSVVDPSSAAAAHASASTSAAPVQTYADATGTSSSQPDEHEHDKRGGRRTDGRIQVHRRQGTSSCVPSSECWFQCQFECECHRCEYYSDASPGRHDAPVSIVAVDRSERQRHCSCFCRRLRKQYELRSAAAGTSAKD